MYIDTERRKDISEKVMDIMLKISTKEEYNYAIALLLHSYLQRNGDDYDHVNDIIGILECVKLEIFRTLVTPDMIKNKKENGHISNLDEKKETSTLNKNSI